MSLRLRIVVGISTLLMLFIMTRLIKAKKIDLKDSLIWYCVCFIVVILDIFPVILTSLASLLGIAIPSNMVFFVAIIMLIVMNFVLTAKVSSHSSKLRRITQEMALLKEEIKDK